MPHVSSKKPQTCGKTARVGSQPRCIPASALTIGSSPCADLLLKSAFYFHKVLWLWGEEQCGGSRSGAALASASDFPFLSQPNVQTPSLRRLVPGRLLSQALSAILTFVQKQIRGGGVLANAPNSARGVGSILTDLCFQSQQPLPVSRPRGGQCDSQLSLQRALSFLFLPARFLGRQCLSQGLPLTDCQHTQVAQVERPWG